MTDRKSLGIPSGDDSPGEVPVRIADQGSRFQGVINQERLEKKVAELEEWQKEAMKLMYSKISIELGNGDIGIGVATSKKNVLSFPIASVNNGLN